jgi:diguanylate cyclase (GGDEF)-like protein
MGIIPNLPQEKVVGDSVAGEIQVYGRDEILALLRSNGLTSWFQPIFSGKTGKIYGYEALTRLADPRRDTGSIDLLFKRAQEEELTPWLDILCQENAFSRAADLGILSKDAYLYINVCPESLMYQDFAGETGGLGAPKNGINKERVILEITEQDAIRNYGLFKEAIDGYRDMGYRIAIDDFGAGYGGLKMLSIIAPDFVKIDRHFITNIHKDSFKYNLVDAFATVCHKLGIAVVAEGIEQEDELATIQSFGIEFLQGYYLERPQPFLVETTLTLAPSRSQNLDLKILTSQTIGQLCQESPALRPDDEIMTAYRYFIKNPECRSLPIVDAGRVFGVLSRSRFLETHLVGPLGYGFSLSKHRVLQDILEEDFLLTEADVSIEKVIEKVQGRGAPFLYDDICVSRNGYYLGMAGIYELLEATNLKNIQLARGSNPLTGLPGNEFIQRTISRLLEEKVDFDICYVDIDNFKPYNDYYGFEKGDMVIRALAEILTDVIDENDGRFHFVGHIGGDDFIVITRPHVAIPACRKIIAGFERMLSTFHHGNDLIRKSYLASDRQGNKVEIPLLSLSIGIVSSVNCLIHSYGELAGMASEVKRAAKGMPGSAIFRNRRNDKFSASQMITLAA